MKSAEDFAVEIRKQLKKDIVKIPKKVRSRRPRLTPQTHRTTQLVAHRDSSQSSFIPPETRLITRPHTFPSPTQIRSMSLKDFFEKYGNDLGEDMLTDIKVRLGLLPPEEARALNVPEPSPAKATTPAPASMAPPPPKALDSAPKGAASMPPPPPMFNNAPVAATPVGKKARTEGGLSDAVGGTFAVPSTPKGAGITVPQTSGSGKIVVAETPGTKRRVKRGEMLYSANGSPLGEGRRVDSGDDDESPVAGASTLAPPSAVKKITMSVKKRTREDAVGGDDHDTGSELSGLVIQTDDGDEIDLGALAGADPDKEGAEKALGVLQNLQANVAAMMAKLQSKQGDA